jgi:hypothetical protein
MGEPLGWTGVWADALRALWEAAGKPTGDVIGRQAAVQKPPLRMTSSSWSDWRNGKNVPSDARTARWLVTFLRGRAHNKTPLFVAADDDWWGKVWKEARAERREAQGGRPPRAHPGLLPVVPVVERVRVGVVPRRADCFQVREAAARLEEATGRDGTVVVGQVLAGLGGVGKTQLAAAFARRAWDEGVTVLVWVTATSRSAIIAAYAEAAAAVGAGVGVEQEPERVAERFLVWAETAGRSWLVVLDDLQNPADVAGLWPPESDEGQVVVTTRRRDAALAGSGRVMVEVGLFTAEEARTFLTAKLGPLAADSEQVAGLASDLGWLPLALAQAAAYMLDQHLDCGAYRTLLKQRLLADVVPESDGLPDDHQKIVAATWQISIDRANKARPAGLARPLLELASVLDPNGIPEAVLAAPAVRSRLSAVLEVRNEQFVEALRTLHRFSLIDHDPDATYREVRVHQLVQRATREALPAPSLKTLARTAADALHAVWPQFEHDELGQVLRANTTALDQAAGAALWHTRAGGHPVLFEAARGLGGIGQVTAAITAYTALYDTALKHLGPHHSDTLTTRRNLAYWRGEAGDAAGAATAFEDLVKDYLRVLGPNHSHTLATRGELARWCGEVGDAAGAATAFEDLVKDNERVLGPDHAYTLATRNGLARWRGEAGDAAGAATAFEDLLNDELRVLGPDHPVTMATRGNLAYWRGRASGKG